MLLASLLAVPVLAGHPSMAAEYTVEPLIAPAPLHGANGMELDMDGQLVVADVGAKRLIAVAVESGDIEVLAENLPIGLAPFMGTAKTFLPTDVVVDEAGVIYLVADGVPTVLKVTALQ